MPQDTLTARLRFEGDAAIAGMNKASRSFTRMRAGAQQAKRGVQDLKQGFAGMRIAAVAVAGGGAVAVKKFTDFEQQFGAVKAVLGKAREKDFPMLREEALRLGATTGFSATQAAEAMENFARAGRDPMEIMSAINPLLSAAAAEGMDLGTAADIMASNMAAFGLKASEATRVADTLAFVSAKTNTNMVGLNEGLKFAAPVARTLGIELEETAASLGLLADVGLKGTLAGTGLKNALLKISKAAKDGSVKVGKYKAKIVETTDAQGKVVGINLPETMKNIVAQIARIKKPTDKAQAAMKLLGLRGLGAATAFEAMTEKKAETLFKNLRKEAKGTASAMEKMRLDNIYGDFITLTSAVEGFAIQLGDVLSPVVRSVAQGASKFFSDTAKALGALVSGSEGKLKGLRADAVGFATGLKEGFEGARAIIGTFVGVFKGAVTFLKALLSPPGLLGTSGPGIQGLTSFVMKFGALAVSLKVAGSLMSRFGRIAIGTFRVVAGTMKTIKPALAGTIGFLSKKLPALTRVLPRGLSKLTGAVSAAEKITAQPVRVVNFDEAGFGGGGGIYSPGGRARMGGGAEAAAGVRKSWSELGKLGKAARVAGTGVGVVAAAFAGWHVGKAIDEATGLSGSIADLAWNMTKDSVAVKALMEQERQLMRARLERGAVRAAGGKGGTAMRFAAMMADMSRRGIKVQESRTSAKTVAVTRELAIQKFRQRYQGQFTKQQVDQLLRVIQPMLDKIPTKAEWAKRPPIVVKSVMNGRDVGKGVSEADDETRQRGKQTPKGKTPKPRTVARR